MKFNNTIAVLLLGAGLVACGEKPNDYTQIPPVQQSVQPQAMQTQVPQQSAQQPQSPVVVQQQSNDNGMTNMVVGALAGYAIANALSNKSQPVADNRPTTRIIERKVYVPEPEKKTYVAPPVPQPKLESTAPPARPTSIAPTQSSVVQSVPKPNVAQQTPSFKPNNQGYSSVRQNQPSYSYNSRPSYSGAKR